MGYMINFINVFLRTVTNKIFQFKGRSARTEYFIYTFFEMLVFVPYAIWFRYYKIEPTLLNISLLVLFFVFIIIHLFASTSLTIRRLHDCGLKGWWYLLSLIFSPIIFLMFCLIKGDKDKNKYGEPPVY